MKKSWETEANKFGLQPQVKKTIPGATIKKNNYSYNRLLNSKFEMTIPGATI